MLTRAARSHQEHARTGAKGAEPVHGVEPCHAPYEGAVAPCTPAELGNQGSNLDSSGPEPDVLPDYTIPHQPLSGISAMRGYWVYFPSYNDGKYTQS